MPGRPEASVRRSAKKVVLERGDLTSKAVSLGSQGARRRAGAGTRVVMRRRRGLRRGRGPNQEREAKHNAVAGDKRGRRLAGALSQQRRRPGPGARGAPAGERLQQSLRCRHGGAQPGLPLRYLGLVRALGRFAPVATLRLGADQAELLLNVLITGPQRSAVLGAIRTELAALARRRDRRSGAGAGAAADRYLRPRARTWPSWLGTIGAGGAGDAAWRRSRRSTPKTRRATTQRYPSPGEFSAHEQRQIDGELARIGTDHRGRATRRATAGSRAGAPPAGGGVGQPCRPHRHHRRLWSRSSSCLRQAHRLLPDLAPGQLEWTLVKPGPHRFAPARATPALPACGRANVTSL